MFQEGGAATIDPDLFFIDKIKGEKKFIDRDVLLKNLVEDATGQTIVALIQVPQSEIEYSPKAQELLRQVVAQTQSGISSIDPNRFRFGERLPGGLYYGETAGRVASLAGDYGAQAAEGLFNVGRGLFRKVGRGGATREDAGPIDIFPSERFPFDPERRGGVAKRADRAGLLREGIPQADLVTTLSRAQIGDVITDFAPEIADITDTTEESVPTFDFRDDDQRSKVESAEMFREQQRRERLEREAEQRAADASPILSDTLGTIDPDDAAARKSAFLESVIGMDEFGEPIPGFDERTGFTEDGLAIAKAIDDLTPIENKVDIDRTEADSLMDIENKFSPTFEPPEPSIDKVDTTITAEMIKDSEERDKRKPKEFSDKTKGQFREVFGSDRFLDFIRNVGGELVRTGQLGEGLASGAAKAAEERATRDLLAEQEDKKFARELAIASAKAGVKDPLSVSELNTISTREEELSENIRQFQKSETTLSNINYIIQTLEAGGATGLRGFFGEATDVIQAAIQTDTGKTFEELQPRTRANALLKVLRQANVREILGESGRTISNLDRKIVEDVFGDIKLGTPLSVSLKKLEDSRDNIINGMQLSQNKVIGAKTFFDKVNYDSDVYDANLPIIKIINSFDIDNARNYVGSQQSIPSAGITEIDL